MHCQAAFPGKGLMAVGVDSGSSLVESEVSSELAPEDVVVALSEEGESWIAVVAVVVEGTVED
jgi:hypothetical protein